MIPILKRMHSPDVEHLDSFAPDDPAQFSILIQAFFGCENEDGEDSFDFIICSPKWLEKQSEKHGIVNVRHHLVMNKFDINKVREFLKIYASQCKGDNWKKVADKLGRLGHWEFEDYRESLDA